MPNPTDNTLIIGATRCYGDDAWFQEFTVHGMTFLAPLDQRDEARHVLGRLLSPRPLNARPLDEWHEDIGPVVWWCFPIEEPAWIGTPDDSDWPGYHTHWTPHPPVPATPKATEG